VKAIGNNSTEPSKDTLNKALEILHKLVSISKEILVLIDVFYKIFR